MKPFQFFTINVILYCYICFIGFMTMTDAASNKPSGSWGFLPSKKGTGSQVPGNQAPKSTVTVPGLKPGSKGAPAAGSVRCESSQSKDPVKQEKPWGNWFQGQSSNQDSRPNQIVEKPDDDQKAIYTYTTGLLVLGMNNWIKDSSSLKNTQSYLGYHSNTVNVINVGMTQLMGQHRKNVMNVTDLLNTFYYACDLPNLLARPENNVNKVKIDFKSFLNIHASTYDGVKNLSEKQLVENLTARLKNKIGTVQVKFSVTIPLMKNMILLSPTSDIVLNGLRDRPVDPERMWLQRKSGTLHDLAESCAACTVGTNVNENHLKILAELIPLMFRYVFDVVVLFLDLYKLSAKNGISNDQLKAIRSFSTFIERFNSLFVERYLEFKGVSDTKLMLELNALAAFFKSETKSTNGNLLDCNRFLQNKASIQYSSNTWNMINRVLNQLMSSFKYSDKVESSIRDSKRLSNPSALGLENTINNEIKDGLKLMDTYSSYFIKLDSFQLPSSRKK